MGRVLITGGSHSGGNWLTEIVRASGQYGFTPMVEDRELFNQKLWEGYGTKLAIGNPGMCWDNLVALLDSYPDMKVLFITRHPIDTCLSKIVRGHPKVGDGQIANPWDYPWDCTTTGSVVCTELAFDIFRRLTENFKERFLWVKMESLITSLTEEVRIISDFLGVEDTSGMTLAHKNVRNEHQKKRYGGVIHCDQLHMFERWDSIHDGFFKDKKELVLYFWHRLIHIVREWGYPVELPK